MSSSLVVVSAIGVDQPGVVAALCRTFTDLHCNIAEMTQSNLRHQFASIFIIEKPEGLSNETLTNSLDKSLSLAQLSVKISVSDFREPEATQKNQNSEPFVVSIYGNDRNDIVGTFAEIFGELQINIEDLRALQYGSKDFMIVYEVSIPTDACIKGLQTELLAKAKSMGLNLTLQHRDIFEAVHRVQIV